MRTLAEPAILKSAALAAGMMCLACYPRLATALELRYPVWYLEALLFLGGIVLWAFTFGWYPKYTDRPLFTLRAGLWIWSLATLAGMSGAVLLHYFIDPSLQARAPSEFPPSLADWTARVLFNLTFTQLLLIFSPFSWLLRLFRRNAPAVTMTVLFGLMVLAVKNYQGPPMPSGLRMGLILFRATASLLSTFLFLRGGVLPVWWCALVLQSRHLFELTTEN